MEHREPEEGGEKLSLSAHRLKVIVVQWKIPHARQHRTKKDTDKA